MKEPEIGKTPEDIEHRNPGTPPSSPTAKVSNTDHTHTLYPNPKPKLQAKIPSDSTPTLPPFISSSSESSSSNSPRDWTTDSQAGALRKQNRRWHTEFFLSLSSKIKMHLEWVPANLTYPKLKPAIRSAVAAWVCVVLFVIPAFERAMGQASFVILIGEFYPKIFMRFCAWYSHCGIALGGHIFCSFDQNAFQFSTPCIDCRT